MKSTYTKFLVAFVFFAGIGASSPLLAEPDATQGGHPMGHPAGGQHMESYMHGARWQQSLTDEQRAKIETLKLAMIKKKAPLKAKKNALKTELALLATNDNAGISDINKNIDQLVDLKKQLMRLKYSHIVEVRKVLTTEQRVSFDLAVMRKAGRSKSRRH